MNTDRYTEAVQFWAGLFALGLFIVVLAIAGCGTATLGCNVSAGLHNEIRCGVDLDREPTPGPTPVLYAPA